MGQKTHPIGYRLGVGVDTKGTYAYHSSKDLHGTTSRWSIPSRHAGVYNYNLENSKIKGKGENLKINTIGSNINNYAVFTQRDNIIKSLLGQWLEEDGYIRNKCIVTRTINYTGVYVDALRLEEPTLVVGLYGENRAALTLTSDKGNQGKEKKENSSSESDSSPSVIVGGNTNTIEIDGTPNPNPNIGIGTNRREYRLSTRVEEGHPVYIQLGLLNDYLDSNSTSLISKSDSDKDNLKLNSSSDSNSGDKAIFKIEGATDLRNALTLLVKHKIPCSNLVAKIIGYRRSGGRRQREALRTVMRIRSSLYEVNTTTSTKGVSVADNDNNHDNVNISSISNSSSSSCRGYLMVFKGRVAGAERARTIRYRAGPRPRHTLSAAIDHGFAEASTPSGKVGITFRVYYA